MLLVQLYRGSPLEGADVRGAREETVVGNQRVYVGGDILLAIDNCPVGTLEQLELLVENEYTVGDTLTLTLLRDGEVLRVPVELVEEPVK